MKEFKSYLNKQFLYDCLKLTNNKLSTLVIKWENMVENYPEK